MPQPRHTAIEIGRLLAAVLVVTVHGRPFADLSPQLDFALSDGIARFAVPYFFVVTGYFFADIQDGGARRWFARILILHLVWTALYTPLWIGRIENPADILVVLFAGHAHLWYLPALLLGAALLLVSARFDARITSVVALALYLVGTGLEVHFNLAGTAKSNIRFTRNFLFDAYPLLATGFLLRRFAIPARVRRQSLRTGLALAALAFLAGEIALNGWLIGTAGVFDLYFALILVAPAFLLWLEGVRWAPVGPTLAQTSTAVYFTHYAFLHLGEALFGLSPLGQTVFALALSFATAPFVIRLARRVPLL